jgi:hypothetical protein
MGATEAEASCATRPQLTTVAIAACPHTGGDNNDDERLLSSCFLLLMDKAADDEDAFAAFINAAGTKASTATAEANTT